MKITITPEEGEDLKEEVWDNVIQFTLTGELMRLEKFPAQFRRTHSSDINSLLGMLEATKEDLRDMKRNKNARTN